jgi:hypothetical protein
VLAFALADAAAVATACGVVLAAWALLLQRGQTRSQFEDSLVRQYREVIKPELLPGVLLDDGSNELTEAERDRLHRVYLYLDLCNEQVFLRAIGRVSRATWAVQWSDGIKENLQGNAAIAASWQLIQMRTDDFRELRAFEQEGWDDPRTWEPVWRRPLVRLGLVKLRTPTRHTPRPMNQPVRKTDEDKSIV